MNRSLKTYQGQDIRNVALVGHAHCGKTTLISALLHAAKMTERLGRVDDGSAVTAYDEEDVARRTTMQNALAFAEWRNVKINFAGYARLSHVRARGSRGAAAGRSGLAYRERSLRRGGHDPAGVEVRRRIQPAAGDRG